MQLEDGNRHMKLIEAMKKEFKLMRILWRQIYDHVSRTDFTIFLTTIIFITKMHPVIHDFLTIELF